MTINLPVNPSKKEWALWAAGQGFFIHPILPEEKKPLLTNWQKEATRDAQQIASWWDYNPDYNIGYYTGRFGDNEALVVIDIDVKTEGINGFHTILSHELEGRDFPSTYTQTSPSGGSHFIYRSNSAVRQRGKNFGPGIDIRSKGGNLVGAGSTLRGKAYSSRGGDLLRVPDWIAEKCGYAVGRTAGRDLSPSKTALNCDRAKNRAVFYLQNYAEKGEAGRLNDTLYRVACAVHDFGVDEITAREIIGENWQSNPLPSLDDIRDIIGNAYRYSEGELGSRAPETQFPDDIFSEPAKNGDEAGEKKLHPFAELNKEFAFVMAGNGHNILWETTDEDGKPVLKHINELSFHKMNAAKKMCPSGGKMVPITELWMESPLRRSYKGLCFKPGGEIGPEWYNLWRGFGVEPLNEGEQGDSHPAVAAFLEHARENVCHGDPLLYRWLIGYFAHLVQKPSEKPHTALVFKGKKGVGKSALIERLGELIAGNYVSVANRRFLLSNFNSHLENCLLIKFEEAFWSGEKGTDGTLKDLITGQTHLIERKGVEAYKLKNLTRVCILGNEDWIIPASDDERRYAVFEVGEARREDEQFFDDMRVGLEKGGYSHLLRYLLDFDLTGLSFNKAPKTKALLEQKLETLDPFHQWWYDSLCDGSIYRDDFDGGWPEFVRKDRFRESFFDYMRGRQIRTRFPNERTIGKLFFRCLPRAMSKKKREGEGCISGYTVPSLADCRDAWDKFIGHKSDWPPEGTGEKGQTATPDWT